MKTYPRIQLIPASITSLLVATFIGAGASFASPDENLSNSRCHSAQLDSAEVSAADDSLTGIWRGTYVNQNDIPSKGYLDITEHADGTLSGKWGNGPRSALAIKHGERVTSDMFQWEASSSENEKGYYRIRATIKENTMQLDITYTWRENGTVKGLTAYSLLTRE